ncbi:hypothetical protein ACFO3J_27340 [Streptomyces polygonati]|uniref:Uncharacterized protein n=1 Tax=Streptomyces polygonati TaxID=1617087 RepID=A0ABV8HW24_9ACTN
MQPGPAAVLADDGGDDVQPAGLVAQGCAAVGGRVVVRFDAGCVEDFACQLEPVVVQFRSGGVADRAVPGQPPGRIVSGARGAQGERLIEQLRQQWQGDRVLDGQVGRSGAEEVRLEAGFTAVQLGEQGGGMLSVRRTSQRRG